MRALHFLFKKEDVLQKQLSVLVFYELISLEMGTGTLPCAMFLFLMDST